MGNKGEHLKNEGITAAIENADRHNYNWSISAYNLLKAFLKTEKSEQKFMAEDIRTFADNMLLENPPSNRAWGAIIIKAKKEKLIIFAGYNQVKNPKAHMANAGLWEKVRI